MFRRTQTLLFLTLILSLTGCSGDNAEIATLRDELHVLRIGNFQLRSIIADFENHLESAGREIERVRVNTHVNDSRMTAQIKVLAHDRRKDGVAYKSALSRLEDRAEENKLLLDIAVHNLLYELNPEQPISSRQPGFQEALDKVDPLSTRLLVPMKSYIVGMDSGVTLLGHDGLPEKQKVGEYLPFIATKHGWSVAELYAVNKARAYSEYNQWNKLTFFTPPFPKGMDYHEPDIYQPLGTVVRVPIHPLENVSLPGTACNPTGHWAGVAYDGAEFDVAYMRSRLNWWDFEVQLNPDGAALQLYTFRAGSRVEWLHEGYSDRLADGGETIHHDGEAATWEKAETGIVFHDGNRIREDLDNPDGVYPRPIELIFDGCNILRAHGTRIRQDQARNPNGPMIINWYQTWYRLPDPENSDKQ